MDPARGRDEHISAMTAAVIKVKKHVMIKLVLQKTSDWEEDATPYEGRTSRQGFHQLLCPLQKLLEHHR
jgi:hypothetical protein